jgi:hypothetical protein
MPDRRLAGLFALAALAFVACVYLPDIGHGFLKDDYTWIASARQFSGQIVSVFTVDSAGNFFRPAVTLSFLADYLVHGLDASGYGVTNLFLALTAAALVAFLARALGLSMAAGAAAGALWLMNPHGINMSLLWISGRTSLLMAVFSTAAVVAAVKRRPILTAVLLFAALLSKEDALLVPAIVVVAMWTVNARQREMVTTVALSAVAVGAYIVLRIGSDAMTAADAPDFYRLTWNAAAIAANALAYLDRSATFAAAVALLVTLAARVRPDIDRASSRRLVLAAAWFLAGIAITVRVPVRSSLYAVFPSIGGALAFAVVFERLRQRTRRASVALGVLLVAAIAAAPLYRARNVRWIQPADVSRNTLSALMAEPLPDAGLVTFEDEPVRFANFADALGTGAGNAVRLATGHPLDAVIVPRGDRSTAPTDVARFRLTGGVVQRVR